MQENKMDLNCLVSTSKTCGIDMNKGNYSVDMMKKQVYIHELNNYLHIKKHMYVSTDKDVMEYKQTMHVIEFMEKRIKEFDARNK
jgi:hypothetical protein